MLLEVPRFSGTMITFAIAGERLSYYVIGRAGAVSVFSNEA